MSDHVGDDPTPHAGSGAPRRSATQLATDPAFTGTYAGLRSWYGRNVQRSKNVFPVMASPPTVAALATANGITSSVYWPQAASGSLTPVSYPIEHWRYLGCQRPIIYGTVNPDYNYAKFQSFSTYAGNAVGGYGVEFYHYGTQVEFLFKGLAGAYQIVVDDELVQAAPFTTTNTGAQYRQLVTFGSAAVRKIRFLGYNLPWGGINTGPNDQIWVTEARGPRVAILGDSYTGGTGSTGGTITSWASHMCETLGWPDRYHAYTGGSGYLNPGSNTPFSSRVANDVIANSPDVVIVAGGHNDDSTYTAAAIGTAASSLLATIRAGLPSAQILVASPFWGSGPEGWLNTSIDTRDAIKNAATGAGAVFLDLMEMPLGRTPQSGTMAGSAAQGATSVASPINVPIRSWFQIDESTAYDRRYVTNESGGSAPFTLSCAALSRAHSAGAPIREVGASFVTGNGKVGATTGIGNADVFTSSDGTHWTDAGHAAVGRAMAELFTRIATTY